MGKLYELESRIEQLEKDSKIMKIALSRLSKPVDSDIKELPVLYQQN